MARTRGEERKESLQKKQSRQPPPKAKPSGSTKKAAESKGKRSKAPRSQPSTAEGGVSPMADAKPSEAEHSTAEARSFEAECSTVEAQHPRPLPSSNVRFDPKFLSMCMWFLGWFGCRVND